MTRPGSAAWVILGVALVVRIAVVVATPHFSPAADAADYDRYASSLASGHGYPESDLVAGGGPTAFRPPVYPVFLGAVYKLPGPNWTEGRIAQALLGTLIVALIGVLASQVWSRRVALWAMAVGAVAPPLILLGASLISEPLFLVFELAAIAALIEHRRSQVGYRWLVAAGALIGLATLTRVNGAFLAIPLGLAAWTLRPRLSIRSLAGPAAFLATVVLVMAPWVIRNAVELHAFIPLSTQGDFALARNFNDLARDDPNLPSAPHTLPADLAVVRDPSLTEAEAARELGSRARRYMRDHPGYVVATVLRNVIRTVQLRDVSVAGSSETALGIDPEIGDVGTYGFYALAALALVGAFLPAARRAPWFFWVAPLFAFAPALLISAGRARYRAPIDPFIVTLAAIALLAIWDRLREPAPRVTPTRSSPAASS